MKERWKSIADFPNYMVSDQGKVKSLVGGYKKPGRILKPLKTKDGYLRVHLYNKTLHRKRIHRLVLETFVGPCPEGYSCDHINRVRTDNRLSNLHWITKVENDSAGGRAFSKLKDGEKWLLMRIIKSGVISQREISDIFKINHSTVSRYKTGRYGKI